MRALKILFPLLLCLLLPLGCDSWSGVDITDSGQLAKLPREIEKYLPPGALIGEIRLYYADQRERNIMGSAYVVYKNPPSEAAPEEAQHVLRLLLDGQVRADGSTLKKPVNAVWQPLKLYDFSRIPELLALAGPHLEDWDFEHAGVRSFAMRLEGEPPLPVYRFIVDGRPKSSPVTTVGSYPGIYYHEMHCLLTRDGEFKVTVSPVLQKKRGGL